MGIIKTFFASIQMQVARAARIDVLYGIQQTIITQPENDWRVVTTD